jgi:hypothetical protein
MPKLFRRHYLPIASGLIIRHRFDEGKLLHRRLISPKLKRQANSNDTQKTQTRQQAIARQIQKKWRKASCQ